MSSKYMKSRGFILPTVLALSLTVVAIMVVMITATTATYKGSFKDHYQKLADEAAEAGAAYATACLSLSNHSQTWGPAASKGDLRPSSDCNGDATYGSNTYVYSDSNVRTYFTVGNLDYSQQFSAQISSNGYTEALRSDGSVAQTYTSIQKKSISWPTDVVAQMSDSGTNRTCAIVNYRVYCWGFNGYGQLGDGRYAPQGSWSQEAASPVDSTIPVKVLQEEGILAGKKIVKIFVAQYHTCALSDDGLVYCWGSNANGQLGRGTTGDGPSNAYPAQVQGALAGKVVTDIGGTNNVSCAIADGKIYCWGSNVDGMSGVNTNSGNTPSPTLVTAGNTSTTLPTNYTATMLANSGSRSRTMCALANGKAYCWGMNYNGSLGTGDFDTDRWLPTKVVDTGVLAGKTITTISQDGYLGDGVPPANGGPVPGAHVCVIASGGLYCWGDNSDGQLGINSTVRQNVPVAVDTSGALNGKTIQDVKLGLYHTCARASGGMYCWGKNNYGQVGDGTSKGKLVPTPVALRPGNLTSSNVVMIGAGANRSCAVINDGRTFCAGLNAAGQIGDGTKINRNVPTESLFLRPVGNQYIF